MVLEVEESGWNLQCGRVGRLNAAWGDKVAAPREWIRGLCSKLKFWAGSRLDFFVYTALYHLPALAGNSAIGLILFYMGGPK